ncbi:hypothetical protein [Umezawaea sp.]|uniref:hypothetical protein n=1 Tax=Umezawaea sp. TaxID=1955258 RepID=UPI002ECFDED9
MRSPPPPDALTTSLPSFTRIGVVDADQALLDASRTLFRDASRRLFSDVTGLRVGGAQANGFAVSGLAKAVLALPADSPLRVEHARGSHRPAGDSAAFAVGAYLTAGQQVAARTPGCWSPPRSAGPRSWPADRPRRRPA